MNGILDRSIAGLGVALVLATAVVAVTVDRHTASASSGGKVVASAGKLTIKDFKFVPASVKVRVGTKVSWTNQDSAEHTATVDSGSTFDTGAIQNGQTKTTTLSKPGTYSYHCAFHAYMKGTIEVVS